MNNTSDKLKILNIQLIGSYFFIISILISILLTYNQKLYILDKKHLFNYKQTYIISNFNRLLSLAIVIAFLYSSYQLREISKKNDSNVNLNNLDVLAASLSVVGAIIELYITSQSTTEDVLDIENPNI